MKPILEPWPHLLKLFTAFLNAEDAIEAKAVSYNTNIPTCRCKLITDE